MKGQQLRFGEWRWHGRQAAHQSPRFLVVDGFQVLAQRVAGDGHAVEQHRFRLGKREGVAFDGVAVVGLGDFPVGFNAAPERVRQGIRLQAGVQGVQGRQRRGRHECSSSPLLGRSFSIFTTVNHADRICLMNRAA